MASVAGRARNRLEALVITGPTATGKTALSIDVAERLGGEIVAVISNEPDAYGLQRARDAGIDAVVLPHREYESRDAYDGALIKVIE